MVWAWSFLIFSSNIWTFVTHQSINLLVILFYILHLTTLAYTSLVPISMFFKHEINYQWRGAGPVTQLIKCLLHQQRTWFGTPSVQVTWPVIPALEGWRKTAEWGKHPHCFLALLSARGFYFICLFSVSSTSQGDLQNGLQPLLFHITQREAPAMWQYIRPTQLECLAVQGTWTAVGNGGHLSSLFAPTAARLSLKMGSTDAPLILCGIFTLCQTHFQAFCISL